MALAVDVRLLSNTYEAGRNGRVPEWPPHPARLFCALVAAAEPGTVDDDALQWLEAQDPPVVLASVAESSTLTGFVPTNERMPKKRGSQLYPGRNNGARSWPRALPAVPFVRLLWPHVKPPAGMVGQLDALARRAPYLGRASGTALVSVSEAPDEPPEGLDRLEPHAGNEWVLRVPYSGYLDGLRRAFDSGERADTASRVVTYGQPIDPAPAEVSPVTAAYPHLLTLGFAPGTAVDGWHALAVARAFKAAILSRLGKPRSDDPWSAFADERLALVNGHCPAGDERRHCAALALPFVGAPHASGEILGVGLALSPDLEPDVRLALLRLFGFDREPKDGPRLTSLRVPGLGRSLDLGAPDGWTVETSRWQRPSRRWASALPIVLDWWPKRSLPAEEIVLRGCEVAGYPRPAAVELWLTSPVAGAPFLRPRDRRRHPGEPLRPWVHAILTFDQPVPGPVVLGHLRHLGLGLCIPQRASDHG